MARVDRRKDSRPPSLEERLGHIWGILFVVTVVVLTGLLVGKGCFFPG